MQRYGRNLPILYLISLFEGMCFYASIASLYRQAAGLSLSQIALIEAISFVFSLVMELPWGVVADRIGYRRTMILSCGAFFASKLVFWRAESFSGFLLERFLLSVAVAGLSGVDESILYLSAGEAHSQRAFGISAALGQAGLLFSAAVYARFLSGQYRLAALCTAVSYGVMFLLSFLLVEVRGAEQRQRTNLKSFLDCLRDTLGKRRLLTFLLGFTLYDIAVATTVTWLSQNLYLRAGMTDAGIGWVYLLVPLAGMLGALSDRLTRRLGEGRFGTLLFLLSGVGCAALAFTRNAALAVACVTLVAGGNALIAPLMAQIENREVTSADRATQLSAFTMLTDIAAAIATAAYGRVADFSLTAGMLACAAACMLSWACFALYRQKRRKPTCEPPGTML